MSKGRNANGRFATGNRGGPGNPHARRVGQIRARLLAAITDDDLEAVIRTLVENAKAGEPWAVKELLNRLIGSSTISQADEPESLADMLGV